VVAIVTTTAVTTWGTWVSSSMGTVMVMVMAATVVEMAAAAMAAHEHLADQFAPVYQTEHGSALVSPGGYVRNVNIRSDARGQGHGSALLSQITADADRLGSSLTLHAREDLHPWYERHGFKRVATDPFGPRLEREAQA